MSKMSKMICGGVIAASALTAAAATAAVPAADAVVAKAIARAGGDKALKAARFLATEIERVEVTSGAEQRAVDMNVLVVPAVLSSQRLQLNEQVVLTATEGAAWATIGGELDNRPRTDYMARGTINQNTFPLLLPFSLRLPGVVLGAVRPTTFEGQPAHAVTVTFAPGFFASPTMMAPWEVVFSADDGRLLQAGFLPEARYHEVGAEGMQYRYLGFEEIAGLRLPKEVLLQALEPRNGQPSGHHARITARHSVPQGVSPATFIHPKELERLEEGDATE